MGHSADRYYRHKEPRTTVRFSSQEWERVKQMQATLGMSIPAILKKALLERFDLERPIFAKDQAREVIAALNKWGGNLNQIAKRVNSGERFGMNASFNALASELFNLRRLILVGHGRNKD